MGAGRAGSHRRAGVQNQNVKIELLYFGGCPHHQPTRELIDTILSELDLDAEVEEVDVRDQQEAERLRFLGSPSIRVDGADIEPGANSRTGYALSCRMYGSAGMPSRQLLEAALGEFRHNSA